MIVSRTPFRLPLGGGGTDLPSYYSKYGGSLLSVAISKYIYVIVNRNFDKGIKVSYRKIEEATNLDEVQHPIAREALRLAGVHDTIEVFSMADAPGNTGLGSSSAYAVGLLNCLYTYRRKHASPQVLADEACKIELEILKEPIGKQDQYMAAFGGLTKLDIGTDGKVSVSSPMLSESSFETLENNLIMFYTGYQRSASDVLKDQNDATKKDEGAVVENLHKIKDIGAKIVSSLEDGNVDAIGPLFHQHWMAKRKLSGKISNPEIDGLYETGMRNGATGGKLIGAGGGGFIVFYCPTDKSKLRSAMKAKNAPEFQFKFDYEGSKIVFNP
ncbi:MAG: galactokinase [Candidatus Micrarchaeia archaeon]